MWIRKRIRKSGSSVRTKLVYLSRYFWLYSSKSLLTRVSRTLEPAFEAERSWQTSDLYAKIQSRIGILMDMDSKPDTALAHAQALLAKHSSRRRSRFQARVMVSATS